MDALAKAAQSCYRLHYPWTVDEHGGTGDLFA
jgi:hypothetical protein